MCLQCHDGGVSNDPRPAIDHESWGASTLTRVLMALVMLAWLAAAIGAALDQHLGTSADGPNDHYYAAIMMVLAIPCFWRCSFYPKVIATANAVTIRNPIRTRTVEWSAIQSVRPGYSGLVFRLKDGASVTAWAVQQANISTWLKRPTRAKRIVERIAELSGVEARL